MEIKKNTNNSLPRLDLPDYDWEKQYEEDCEFIRNIPDEYKKMKRITENSSFQN